MTLTSFMRNKTVPGRRPRRYWTRKRVRRAMLVIALLIAAAYLGYDAAQRASGATLETIPGSVR